MSEYFYASKDGKPGNAACVGSIEGIDCDFYLGEGKTLEELEVGDTVTAQLEAAFDGPMEDFMETMSVTLLVSDRARAVIEAAEPAKIEFIPVDVRDARGKKSLATYHAVHPVDLPDALDLEASGVRMNTIDEDAVSNVEKLVVDESKLAGRTLTRIARYETPILFHASLVERIREAGLTGVTFKPLAEYSRFDAL